MLPLSNGSKRPCAIIRTCFHSYFLVFLLLVLFIHISHREPLQFWSQLAISNIALDSLIRVLQERASSLCDFFLQKTSSQIAVTAETAHTAAASHPTENNDSLANPASQRPQAEQQSENESVQSSCEAASAASAALNVTPNRPRKCAMLVTMQSSLFPNVDAFTPANSKTVRAKNAKHRITRAPAQRTAHRALGTHTALAYARVHASHQRAALRADVFFLSPSSSSSTNSTN